MTTLTDRYIAATVRELPRERRTEIGNELQESIADQIDAKVSAGSDRATAEYEVLTQMGDPMRLAASYAGRQLALIGPMVYPAWRRFLLLLLMVLVPLLAVLAGVGAVLDDQSFGSVVGSVVGAAAMTAVQVTFWVTLVFAIVERVRNQDASVDRDLEWTPKDLPSTVSHDQGLGELAGDVIGSAVLIGLLLYQQLWLSIDGERMPLVNPDVSWWTPFMIAALAASALVTIWIGVSGRVTATHVAATLAVGIVAVAPTIYLAVSDQLLNPAFVAHFSWLSDNVTTVNTLICIGFVLAWGIDVVERAVKAYRSLGT